MEAKNLVYASTATTFCVLFYFQRDVVQWVKKHAYLARFEDVPVDPSRRDQVLYSNVDKGHFENLNPDLMCDMVTYISDSTDGVRSYHEKHRWLECFILPLDQDATSEVSEDFHNARVAFELAPAEFIVHVERFSELLKIRDLCKLLLRYLVGSSNEKRRQKLQSWLELQDAILKIMKSDESSNGPSTIDIYDSAVSNWIKLSLQQLRASTPETPPPHPSAADQLQEFLKRVIHDNESQKPDKIIKSWREEHRRSLLQLFKNWKNQQFIAEMLRLVKSWSEDSRLLSAEQDKFQSNLCLFVEAKTGRKGLRYGEAIQFLREMSFTKNEQSKILYEAIEKQHTTIALQQQIITCLEYRHVLESLPKKNSSAMTALTGTNSGSGAWQKTWKFAVEDELEKMMTEYITAKGASQPAPSATNASTTPAPSAAGPSATGAPSSAPAILPPSSSTHSSVNSATPPSLRALLQSDFNNWASYSQQLKTAQSVPTAMPAATGTASNPPTIPPAPHAKRPQGRGAPPAIPGPWTTGRLPCIENFKPHYETWPSFQTGYNLYSELSGNIHTYGNRYEVNEINFTKSHRIILKWLNPKLGVPSGGTTAATDGEVDWDAMWTSRGLPT